VEQIQIDEKHPVVAPSGPPLNPQVRHLIGDPSHFAVEVHLPVWSDEWLNGNLTVHIMGQHICQARCLGFLPSDLSSLQSLWRQLQQPADPALWSMPLDELYRMLWVNSIGYDNLQIEYFGQAEPRSEYDRYDFMPYNTTIADSGWVIFALSNEDTVRFLVRMTCATRSNPTDTLEGNVDGVCEFFLPLSMVLDVLFQAIVVVRRAHGQELSDEIKALLWKR
jgi:hypothetical protein